MIAAPLDVALLLVDIQNDFLPQGALAVASADQIIPVVNQLQECFDHVLATCDWHPKHHTSFASTHHKKVGEKVEVDGLEQILWPDHCIQDTFGAKFAPGLKRDKISKIFFKGVDARIDSYGAFYDNGRKRATGLEEYLKQHRIGHLVVVGLTTDYCVKYTVLDGLALGFKMTVVTEGCRAVNLHPDDERNAFEQMRLAGADIVSSQKFLSKAR